MSFESLSSFYSIVNKKLLIWLLEIYSDRMAQQLIQEEQAKSKTKTQKKKSLKKKKKEKLASEEHLSENEEGEVSNKRKKSESTLCCSDDQFKHCEFHSQTKEIVRQIMENVISEIEEFSLCREGGGSVL